MEREFGAVLEACFSQTPLTFIRTNDALHLVPAARGGAADGIQSAALVRFSCASQRLSTDPPTESIRRPWPQPRARSRLRISADSNVELKCYACSRKRIVSERKL